MPADLTDIQPSPPSRPLPPDDRRCTATGKDGGRCRAWAGKDGSGLCRGHSVTPEEQRRMREAAERARAERARARADTVERGRKGLKALMAEALEAEAQTLVDRLLDIVRNGSDADAMRAAELLASRVYGKPVQPTEDLTPQQVPTTAAEVRAMTPEERRSLIALALPAHPEAAQGQG